MYASHVIQYKILIKFAVPDLELHIILSLEKSTEVT